MKFILKAIVTLVLVMISSIGLFVMLTSGVGLIMATGLLILSCGIVTLIMLHNETNQ